jgi:hypothetical protein
MAFAYTPGLRVSEYTVVRKERRLPLTGETLVKEGDSVTADTIVAKTELPGNVKMLNIANVMGLPPGDIIELLSVVEGATIEKDEVLGQTKGFFGMFKNTVRSPIEGVFESYNRITGQAVLREPPIPVAINAYLKGTVTGILKNEGVIVESNATFVQGIFGIGGETRGEIKVMTAGPADELTEDLIDESCRDKILLGGSFVSYKTLNKAIHTGVKAIIVGGFDDKDLIEFLGYDLGVAITGHEKKGITLILTEGFGRMSMAGETFKLLKSREGMMASVNGATQIRAGVMRPEVIIPTEKPESDRSSDKQAGAMDIGSPVRCIRAPYFGRLGTVAALPAELQVLDSEAKVRVLEVKFDSGDVATVPRANVELIEE